MTALLEPFFYEYMRNAIGMSALVGGLCAYLSCYLMLKGWSLIGDALSHAIVLGVVVAYMLRIPLLFGAFVASGLAVAALLLLTSAWGLSQILCSAWYLSRSLGWDFFWSHLADSVDASCWSRAHPQHFRRAAWQWWRLLE